MVSVGRMRLLCVNVSAVSGMLTAVTVSDGVPATYRSVFTDVIL